jgi:hypothetical protein
MDTATLENDPREDWMGPQDGSMPRPKLFPDELRTQVQQSVHEAEPPWASYIPANPTRDLREIASKVFTKADREQIQQCEDEIGAIAADRGRHCNLAKFEQDERELAQDINILPENFAKRSLAIKDEREAMPAWTMALNSREARLKEKLRPYALRVAMELPGKLAKSINEIESITDAEGSMYGINASVIINPLLRLHSLAVSWVESLKSNDDDAKESRIRAILADSGVLEPKVPVFRRQF